MAQGQLAGEAPVQVVPGVGGGVVVGIDLVELVAGGVVGELGELAEGVLDGFQLARKVVGIVGFAVFTVCSILAIPWPLQ